MGRGGGLRRALRRGEDLHDLGLGPDDVGGFLDGWPARSRRVEVAGRTGWDAANGWLVTRLGTTERAWGRLVIGSPEPPSQRLVAVAERDAGGRMRWRAVWDGNDSAAGQRRHRRALRCDAYALMLAVLRNGRRAMQADLFGTRP